MPDNLHTLPDRSLSEPEDDPFVAEVRAIRDAMLAEVGGDVERLYDRFKAREDAERAAGREIIAPPPRPTSRTGAA